ncbi:peripheral-type benzodiazepine receptor-associated protein 1-like [Paroedura picta]|uniref:peripheral-type benzodiazepine receptor-associated protein 1-like n=1 Tax=Paroedura picta TaxID=143630 RepID=UPI004056D579
MSKETPSGRGRGPPSLRNPPQPSRGSKGNGGSCRPPQSHFQEDHRREREALRAELEAERMRSKEAQRRFTVEIRELREAAERDRQLLADQLHSKWEQQQAREIQQLKQETKKLREAEIRDLLRWKKAELHEAQQLLQQERDAAMRQARDLQRQLAKELVLHESGSRGPRGGGSGGRLSTECHAKLEEVLGKLRWEVDSDQAIRIRHLEEELELERRLFLKYILERFEGKPLLAASLDRFRKASLPTEDKVNSWRATGECVQENLPQQGWSSGDSYNQLRKQNTDLLNARKVLEQRCSHLEEENAVLREQSLPDMQEKVRILKRKSAELIVIAKRLEEAAEKLQESNCGMSNTPGTLALCGSGRDLCENGLALQQGKDLNEQDRVLLAKDQQIEALQKECEELQARLSARKENHRLLDINELDSWLRESRREVLRLRRLIALKSQRDSAQTSGVTGNGSSSGILQEAPSSNQVCFEDIPLAKKKRKTPNILKKPGEPQELPFSSDAKNCEISNLISHSKHESPLQLLEKQLVGKYKPGENLGLVAEENQKKREDVKLKLHKLLSLNARISEENAKLRGKNERVEKVENENADLKVKVIQATDERNSVVQLTQGLEIKVQNLEQAVKSMQETAERQQQLEREHQKTLLELQKKEEEIRQLRQAQTEITREHQEEVQLFETQVKELERLHLSHLGHIHPNPFRLRLFLARYSYDPFSGPNKNPEAELPLIAGEYVYICGDKDEDGFYAGQLMDGRRGFVPSNLVEEVAGNELFSFIPSEPSNISYDSAREFSFSRQSPGLEEKSNSPQEDRCVNLLCDGAEGTLCEIQATAPYPQNLSLLNLRNITATSAEIAWFPSGGSCTHLVYLNEEKHDETKPGIHGYTFRNLNPSTQYRVRVEPLVPREDWVYPQGWLEPKSAEMTFTTPSAGPPPAPLDVRVQAGSSADEPVISWLPETIHPSGSYNGVKVTGYAVYINGHKVTNIMSPTAAGISLDASEINMRQGPQTVSVRTVSPFGESADSVPALIPSNLWNVCSTALSQSVTPEQTSKNLLESEGWLMPDSEDTGMQSIFGSKWDN